MTKWYGKIIECRAAKISEMKSSNIIKKTKEKNNRYVIYKNKDKMSWSSYLNSDSVPAKTNRCKYLWLFENHFFNLLKSCGF